HNNERALAIGVVGSVVYVVVDPKAAAIHGLGIAKGAESDAQSRAYISPLWHSHAILIGEFIGVAKRLPSQSLLERPVRVFREQERLSCSLLQSVEPCGPLAIRKIRRPVHIPANTELQGKFGTDPPVILKIELVEIPAVTVNLP